VRIAVPSRFLRGAAVGALFAAAPALGPSVARAQTAPTSTSTAGTPGAVVAATLQVAPDRILPNNATYVTRPPNLNPLGVSFSDCAEDLILRFHVTVSNFDGSESLQVWATRSGDCSNDMARGVNGAAAATCWLVNQGDTGLRAVTPTTRTYDVRVTNLVGPQNHPPFPAVLVNDDTSVCPMAQTSFVAVPMDVWFVPVGSNGLIAGTAYDYSIPGGTDLVGPPAPTGVNVVTGDTFATVNWTPNSDSDTGGYDIYIDPIPGQEQAGAGTAAADAEVVCDEASASSGSTSSGAGSSGTTSGASSGASSGSDDASSDATVDATAGAPSDATTPTSDATSEAEAAASGDDAAVVPADANCHVVNHGGTASGAACNSAVLMGGIASSDAGPVETPIATGDDGGGDAETVSPSTNTGPGGISTIPCQNGIGNLCQMSTGVRNLTVTGLTASTFTVSGLQNGTNYNFVVSAVDNFGNIGLPSAQTMNSCGVPALVNDFWTDYRSSGGQAGGGFCALEAVGAPASSTIAFAGAGALLVAGARRRGRGRNDRKTRPSSEPSPRPDDT
jgi:hypothetical protein